MSSSLPLYLSEDRTVSTIHGKNFIRKLADWIIALNEQYFRGCPIHNDFILEHSCGMTACYDGKLFRERSIERKVIFEKFCDIWKHPIQWQLSLRTFHKMIEENLDMGIAYCRKDYTCYIQNLDEMFSDNCRNWLFKSWL